MLVCASVSLRCKKQISIRRDVFTKYQAQQCLKKLLYENVILWTYLHRNIKKVWNYNMLYGHRWPKTLRFPIKNVGKIKLFP